MESPFLNEIVKTEKYEQEKYKPTKDAVAKKKADKALAEKNKKTTSNKKISVASQTQKSPFEDAVNKGWERYKNGLTKTCPACGGNGKSYTSERKTNTYQTYSEDNTSYTKTTKTTESDYYTPVKCNRCNGSGKVKK